MSIVVIASNPAPVGVVTAMSGSTPTPLGKRRMLFRLGVGALVLAVILALLGWVGGWAWLLRLALVSAATGLLWLGCARFTRDEPLRPAQRRYMHEFLWPMLAYVVVLMASVFLLKQVQSTPLRWLLALAPVVPVAFAVRAMVRVILASDELERRQQLEAISIASLSVGLLSFAAAFAHGAGLLSLHSPLMWVLPALFVFYGLAMWWVRRRYSDE